MLRSLQVALIFMTTLPMPFVKDWQDDDMRLAVRTYPIVGLVIGAILAALFLLTQAFSPNVQAVLVTAAWLVLTGALHFDGFSDMADAVFASKSPEERQKIAKDVSVGAFALAASIILILLKVTSITDLSHFIWLIIIPTLARTLIYLPMSFFKLTSSSRLGRSSSVSFFELRGSFLISLLVLCVLMLVCFSFLTSVLVLGFSTVFVLLLAFWLTKRMDGLSGDAYGAIIELTEVFVLLLVSLL